MMDYNSQEVDRLSGTTEAQRATNFRWLALQGEQTKIEAMKLQTDLIRQNRRQGIGQTMTPEFVYAMFALALVKMIWAETAQRRKGGKLSAEEFENIQEIRIDRIRGKKRKKTSPKKEVIRVRYFQLIQTLREKELSWRQIADYISTHHKVKFTHSYIRQSFLELSEEKARTEVTIADNDG
jgi:hypothetical protein